jgi:hypothetical protein
MRNFRNVIWHFLTVWHLVKTTAVAYIHEIERKRFGVPDCEFFEPGACCRELRKGTPERPLSF